MSDSIWPWIILAVVAIIAIALVVATMKKRKAEEHRAQAAELRNEAAGQAGGIRESDRAARDAEAEAQRKRIEAERAEQQAAEARQAQAQEEATFEDRVREADRLDPDVNHRADDYQPGQQGRRSAETDTDPDAPGAHRGSNT